MEYAQAAIKIVANCRFLNVSQGVPHIVLRHMAIAQYSHSKTYANSACKTRAVAAYCLRI